VSVLPTYRLRISIGRRVRIEGRECTREEFYEWLWSWLDPERSGFLGAHEGTLLSEEAAEQGLETESWTVDSAQAPRERDWVGGQGRVEAELYFVTAKAAESAAKRLEASTDARTLGVAEQPAQDWDAQWKASFLGSPRGLRVPPNWRVVPYWVSDSEAGIAADERVLRINPGAGFGTGTHETTQLCLQAIAESRPSAGARALDFGSGSGILSIALARLECAVDSVEIDPLAIENAKQNADLNGMSARIRFADTLSDSPESYGLIVANILRPVLLEFAEPLAARLASGAPLILSGLIERDVAEVSARYTALLGRKPGIQALGEWRCLKYG
jgi:ribosomal protein L11 methyltransferase